MHPLFKTILFYFFLLLILIGCSTTSSKDEKVKNLPNTFVFQDLKTREIYKLKTRDNQLFAGTSNGLVSYHLSSGLTHAGTFMEGSSVRSFLILAQNNWLMSAYFKDNDASTNIYKSTNQGDDWLNYSNGFGGKRKLIPNTMDARPEDASIIFARATPFTNISKSVDGGRTWRSVNQTWENPLFGSSFFVKIDHNHPNIIWGGGATAQFFSSLLKSTDGGATWKRMAGLYIHDSFVYALAVNTDNSNHLLAGLGSSVPSHNIIYKSTDGGENWQTVFEGINTHTFAHSARDPQVVYASGQNASGTLFFATSPDFGDSWETVEMENSPASMQVNDMVSVMQDGTEVLYLGTNKGVYSYTFEK